MELAFKTAPHLPYEYTVRNAANNEIYSDLFNEIKKHGIHERYGRGHYQYHYAGDGFKYWVMNDDITKSHVINRCKVEDLPQN